MLHTNILADRRTVNRNARDRPRTRWAFFFFFSFLQSAGVRALVRQDPGIPRRKVTFYRRSKIDAAPSSCRCLARVYNITQAVVETMLINREGYTSTGDGRPNILTRATERERFFHVRKRRDVGFARTLFRRVK